MNSVRLVVSLMLMMLCAAPLAPAAEVALQISGPGAVNDSTIKVGEKVSVDIMFLNDTSWAGFTLGFAITSPDIKRVVHPADSGNGLNEHGDVKGYGGFEDRSIWDLAGIFVVPRDWDGELPELLGFGGVCVKRRYEPHDWERKLSFDLIVPEPGTLVIDSAFFPPGGNWLYSAPAHEPTWHGPYHYKVVK
jgi:hypothetical protein